MVWHKSRENNIKNAIYYYLDDLTKINDLAFESIKLDEKS